MTVTRPVGPVDRRRRRRTVAATVAGNFVEYFDWLAFGLYAPLFAGQFFPAHDPVSSLLGAFAVFAAGMLFRPLGGMLLGRFADRRGRRAGLLLSIILMGGGSLVIALSPTYAQIGLAAPVLLLAARCAQGLSAGGEWAAAVAYLMETAPKHRRCLYGGLFSMSAAAGALVASVLGVVASAGLTPAAMHAWGWRVPFAFGGLLCAGLIVARRQLTETKAFEVASGSDAAAVARPGFRRLFAEHWRAVLAGAVFVGGTTASATTWTTVVPSMAQSDLGASPGLMFSVVVVVAGSVMVLQVPIALLADRIGVQPTLAFCCLGFAIAGPVAYLTMSPTFGSLVASYGSGILLVGTVTAIMPTVMAFLFPTTLRALGIGLPQSLASGVFGGITPVAATYLGGRGMDGWFMAGVAVLALAAWATGAWAVRRRHPDEAVDATIEAPENDTEPALGPVAVSEGRAA
jgi:MHS family alpha-ketoglutarate permease-like MFS transporter